MLSLLRWINRITEKIEVWILISGIVLIMVNSTVNAMGRYFFDHSLFFSEEINRFLIVIVTFIGFTYAVRKGRNIRMTAIYDICGPKVQKVAMLLIALITAVLMFYLTYESFKYVIFLKHLNRLSPALEFPIYIVYSVIPLGFFMAGLQYVSVLLMNITHRDIYVAYDLTQDKAE